MSRAHSMRNLFNQTFVKMNFDGIWKDALGNPTHGGAWLIYGAEKNGKTSFALMLANYLSTFEKVLYISAEEGVGDTFVYAAARAGITENNANLKPHDYISIEELRARMNGKRMERIVFVDNITVYKDELKESTLWKLIRDFPKVIFVFLAHEDAKTGEPYLAAAKACKRFAKVIVHVEGLVANVHGRGECPGGRLVVDLEKAALCWGDNINKTNEDEN